MVPILQTAAVPSMPGICTNDTGVSGTEGTFSAAFEGESDQDSTSAVADPSASGKMKAADTRLAESDESDAQHEVLATDSVVVQPIASGLPLFWIVSQKTLLAAGPDRSVAVEAQADVHASCQTTLTAIAGPVFSTTETAQIDSVPAGRPLVATSAALEAPNSLPSPTSRLENPPSLQLVEASTADASTAKEGAGEPKLVPIVGNGENLALASNVKIAPTLGTDLLPSAVPPIAVTHVHATPSQSAFLAKWGGTAVELPAEAPAPDSCYTVATGYNPDLAVLAEADTAVRSEANRPAANDIVLPTFGRPSGVEGIPVSARAMPTVPLLVGVELSGEQENSAPATAGRGQELRLTSDPTLTTKEGKPASAVMIDMMSGEQDETAERGLDFSPLMMQSHSSLPLSHSQNAIAQPVSALAAQVVQVLSNGRSGNTEIALSPEELGHVRLSIQPHDSDPTRVVVMMSFERPEVMDLFRRHADQLLADIRAAGYSGADLSFAQSGKGGQQDGKPGAPPGRGNVDAAPLTPAKDARASQAESSSLDLRL
jgi:Flagellar hook-length control protein FliK